MLVSYFKCALSNEYKITNFNGDNINAYFYAVRYLRYLGWEISKLM